MSDKSVHTNYNAEDKFSPKIFHYCNTRTNFPKIAKFPIFEENLEVDQHHQQTFPRKLWC